MTPWPVSVAFPLTLLASVVLILVFDVALVSFGRRRPSFDYGRTWPLQFALYVVIGFLAMPALLDLRLVEAIGAVTGFVESTLGWAIMLRMGRPRLANTTPASVAVVIAAMTVFGFGLAIAGALAFNAAVAIVLRMHS